MADSAQAIQTSEAPAAPQKTTTLLQRTMAASIKRKAASPAKSPPPATKTGQVHACRKHCMQFIEAHTSVQKQVAREIAAAPDKKTCESWDVIIEDAKVGTTTYEDAKIGT